MISDVAASGAAFGAVVLRYFNVAGAHPSAEIGEAHSPETHLIPIVIQAALGQRSHISIFGTDYETHDGTCIRDYIHVCDLVAAHRLALGKIEAGSVVTANLGIGQGYSVRQIVDAARRVTKVPFDVRVGERRAGDPPELVAAPDKASQVLGWTPTYTEVDDVIATAWEWHRKPRAW